MKVSCFEISSLLLTNKIIIMRKLTINNGALQKSISIASLLSSGIYTVKIIVNDKMYLSKLI